jgi:hypothetical protein
MIIVNRCNEVYHLKRVLHRDGAIPSFVEIIQLATEEKKRFGTLK